jgi:predicted exporter
MTTVLSFGLMGLSRNPGLRGLGLTAGIGSLLSLLLVPAAVALIEPRRSRR